MPVVPFAPPNPVAAARPQVDPIYLAMAAGAVYQASQQSEPTPEANPKKDPDGPSD